MNNHRISQWAPKVLFAGFVLMASFAIMVVVRAADTSNFTQTINAGTLSVDIVNASSSYATVASPSLALSATTFSFNCNTSTGTFSSSTEAVYVQNPDASDSGWVLSIAASDPTDVWDSAGTDMDFNDPTNDGCPTDGGDADTVAGRMQINPSGILTATGTCGTCGSSNLTVGSVAQFAQGSTDSITLVTAAAGSDDIGDWTFRSIGVSQAIPEQQPAASDYDINMVVSIVAS